MIHLFGKSSPSVFLELVDFLIIRIDDLWIVLLELPINIKLYIYSDFQCSTNEIGQENGIFN